MSNNVTCPNCETLIKLDEVLTDELSKKQKVLESEFLKSPLLGFF